MQDQGYFGSWINPSFTLHWSRLAFLGWNRAWRWVTIEIKWKIRLSKTFSAAFVVQRSFNFWVRRLVNSPSSMMRIIQINWLYQQFSHMLPLLLLLVLLVLLLLLLLLLFGFNLFVSSLYSVKRNIGMLSMTREKVKIRTWFGISITLIISAPGGGGYSWEFLVGLCRPVLQILTRFQTKKCYFPYLFSDQTSKIHTRFQTWGFR